MPPRHSRLGAWSEFARAVQVCPGARARSWRVVLRVPPLRLPFLQWRLSKASLLGNGGNRALCDLRPLSASFGNARIIGSTRSGVQPLRSPPLFVRFGARILWVLRGYVQECAFCRVERFLY